MRSEWLTRKIRMIYGLACAVLAISFCAHEQAKAADPIRIGHVAALSGASAQSGEAITRGLALAIDEINAKGGLVGGRQLELVQRDDESVPPKGLTAARELIFKENAARHRAAREQGKENLHGRVGGGHQDYAERRQPELRVPRVRGR